MEELAGRLPSVHLRVVVGRILNGDPRRSAKIGKEAMRLGTSNVLRPADWPQKCISRLLHEILCSSGTEFRAPLTPPAPMHSESRNETIQRT